MTQEENPKQRASAVSDLGYSDFEFVSDFDIRISDFSPKIADFGLAKHIHGEGAQTLSGIIIGTPRYMAPEQAAGRTKEIGPSVDVYGLGVILYEMVVGRPPFQGPSTTETLRQVVSEEAVSPRRLQPKVPRDLETICLKCLEKEPGRRYTSAAALAEDLRRFQAREPIVARPVGPLQRAWRWRRRNPLVAAQAAVVVFLMLAGTAISAIFIAKAGERAAETAREAQRAERGQYISDMRLAGSYWEASRAAWIMDLLDRHLPGRTGEEDLRGFEWFYWDRLCHSEQLALRGHMGPVASVAFSPDGKRVASASLDLTVKIWDAASGKEICTLTGHTDKVNCVAFNPDGKYLASASGDRTLKIWDADSGREIRTFNGHTRAVRCVAFSPNGASLASGGDDQSVRIWDVGTGREIDNFKGHADVRCLAYRADGRRLASSIGGGSAIIWDTVTGQHPKTLKGHRDGGDSVAFSPDGRQLASTGGHDDRTVRIWDAATGEEIRTLKGHTGHVSSVAYRPDGKVLASGSRDKTVRLWEASSGTLKLTLQGHTSSVNGLAFSPNAAN
jgi:DNA-binding beta-propeller fold protein YncE